MQRMLVPGTRLLKQLRVSAPIIKRLFSDLHPFHLSIPVHDMSAARHVSAFELCLRVCLGDMFLL